MKEPRPSLPNSTESSQEERPVAPPPSRRPLAIGFAESPQLRALLRSKLASDSRYAVSELQQIPVGGTALFLSGVVAEPKPEHGWMSCHARYFVASQPELAALQVEAVAASVPMLQVKIFRDRPEVLQLATAACLEQLAEQMVDRIGVIAE